MNKERILESFFRPRPSNATIKSLVLAHGPLFSEAPLTPSLFEQAISEHSHENHDPPSPHDEKRSRQSHFSVVSIDPEKIKEIMLNRKKHAIFKGDAEWWFVDSKSEESGPHSSAKMNSLWALELLNEQTLIKQKGQEEFKPLKALVKKYFANRVSSENVAEKKHFLPSKKSEARKHAFDMIKNDNVARPMRVVSDVPKPTLFFYRDNGVKEENEFEDFVGTRMRSNTCSQR